MLWLFVLFLVFDPPWVPVLKATAVPSLVYTFLFTGLDDLLSSNI